MRLYILGLVFLMSACSTAQKFTEAETIAESKKANAFFATEFSKGLERSPMTYTYLGQKKRYDQLNDVSEAFFNEGHELTKESLKNLKKFKYAALDEKTKLSYRLYKELLEDEIASFKYRYNSYYVNQMFGAQTWIPSFLINMHKVDNLSDAEAYIKRVKGVKKLFSDLGDNLRKQESKGIEYPSFIFDKVISDSKNIISGFPFDEKSKKKSPLYEDFKKKISKIKISKTKRKILLKELEISLKTSLSPAYKNFISYMSDLKTRSKTMNGVWAQPNGKAYYKHNLKSTTSTDMTAPEIHKLGLSEVDRIHAEMRAIMKKVKFKGELQDFFAYVKGNDKFFYGSSEKEKAKYVKDAKKIISDMRKVLDQLFITKPKAELIVKPVEAFREKSAGIAFYQGGALDGSRPGIYYVNLSDMKSVAKYDMEALAYHEGIPGHHMERSMNQEIQDIPMFRKFTGNTAFVEGWGLYSEYIPKEIGFYKDPYSDFGRLSMELWRAARLVVDTGIHHYKWTRSKTIKYLQANTPNSQDEITKGVERYFVMPGQATAYKIGQLKILGLREKAKKELGTKFDIRNFHETVLKNGALPLYELENQVDTYIRQAKK